MSVRINESTGHVDAPKDIYVSDDVRAVFGRPSATSIAYPPGSTLALWFVSARTGDRLPVPVGIRVIYETTEIEPWSPSGEFLLLVDRAYQIWLVGDTMPLFETQPAVRETHVQINARSVATYAPHMRYMMMGSE